MRNKVKAGDIAREAAAAAAVETFELAELAAAVEASHLAAVLAESLALHQEGATAAEDAELRAAEVVEEEIEVEFDYAVSLEEVESRSELPIGSMCDICGVDYTSPSHYASHCSSVVHKQAFNTQFVADVVNDSEETPKPQRLYKERMPCRFFWEKKGCKDGARCKYSHSAHTQVSVETRARAEAKTKTICNFFFQKKGCKDGDHCKWSHIKPLPATQASRKMASEAAAAEAAPQLAGTPQPETEKPDKESALEYAIWTAGRVASEAVHESPANAAWSALLPASGVDVCPLGKVLAALECSAPTKQLLEREAYDLDALLASTHRDLLEIGVPSADAAKMHRWIQDVGALLGEWSWSP